MIFLIMMVPLAGCFSDEEQQNVKEISENNDENNDLSNSSVFEGEWDYDEFQVDSGDIVALRLNINSASDVDFEIEYAVFFEESPMAEDFALLNEKAEALTVIFQPVELGIYTVVIFVDIDGQDSQKYMANVTVLGIVEYAEINLPDMVIINSIQKTIFGSVESESLVGCFVYVEYPDKENTINTKTIELTEDGIFSVTFDDLEKLLINFDMSFSLICNYSVSNEITRIINVSISHSSLDSDSDGVEDTIDQCPNSEEFAQVDEFGCDVDDSDGDGISNQDDKCPNTSQNMEVDLDGCEIGDSDLDSDGVLDSNDHCPDTSPNSIVDGNGCSDSQKDTDEDGVYDSEDLCPNSDTSEDVDSNGCSVEPPYTINTDLEMITWMYDLGNDKIILIGWGYDPSGNFGNLIYELDMWSYSTTFLLSENFIGIDCKVHENELYFASGDDVSELNSLWKTDGSVSGTLLVKEIDNPYNFQSLGTSIIFSASDQYNGEELWITDGTTGGTRILKDIRVGVESSYPDRFYKLESHLFFTADDGINGEELWKTDGTVENTSLVMDINQGSDDSSPAYFVIVNGKLFFKANDGVNGTKIWFTEGDVQTTNYVRGNYIVGSGRIALAGGIIFFNGISGSGGELWRTDGTDSGTNLVKDINSGMGSSNPWHLTEINNTVYFFIYAFDENSTELWRSDGTESGTKLVQACCFIGPYVGNSSKSAFFGVKNGDLYDTYYYNHDLENPLKSDFLPPGFTTLLILNYSPDRMLVLANNESRTPPEYRLIDLQSF